MFSQSARNNVYKQAQRIIPRAIKQFIHTYGVNVQIYKIISLGITGHKDISRLEFEKEPMFEGSAFIPSVITKRNQHSHLDRFNELGMKSNRMYISPYIQIPNSSLIVVRDMGRVINYIVDSEVVSISPNSEPVYSVYELIPYNVIDSEVNQEELQDIEDIIKPELEQDITQEYTQNELPTQSTPTLTDTKNIRFNRFKAVDSEMDSSNDW